MNPSPTQRITTPEDLQREISRIQGEERIKQVVKEHVRSSPDLEEKLVRITYQLESPFTEEQLELIFPVLMECIHCDQILSTANTIKDFRLELRRNTKRFFDDLSQSTFFMESVLTGKFSEVELPAHLAKQLDDFDSPTYEEANEILEELSFRMHLENGCCLNQLSIEKRGSKVFLQKRGPENKIELKDYTPPEIADFLRVASSNDPATRYTSRYQDVGIQEIAIITHGNQRTTKTLEKLIANLAKFGHQNIRISIFDDAPESKLREAIRATSAPSGIKINYIGAVEREAKIAALSTLLDPQKAAAIKDAIGPNTGTGGNRNFVALSLGHTNYITFDDDVEPNVETELKRGKKAIAVDVRTILSRHIRASQFFSCDLRYSGFLDNSSMCNLGVFFTFDHLTSPYDSWKRTYNSKGAKVWDSTRENQVELIYDFRASNVLCGGAMAFAGDYRGASARFPTFINTKHTGRNEDVFLAMIPEIVAQITGAVPHIFCSAASAIQHNREINIRNTNLGKNALEELLGQYMSCIIVHLTHTSPNVRAAIAETDPLLKNPEKIMAAIGQEIIDFYALPEDRLYRRFNSNFITASAHYFLEVRDLFKMYLYQGTLAHPEGEEFRAQELAAWTKNPARGENYKKILADIKIALEHFFGDDFEDLPRATLAQFNTIVLMRSVQNAKEALVKYAKTLLIWPELVAANDQQHLRD